MNDVVLQALRLMTIALPVMFGVIIVFIILTKVLIALFPAKKND